MKKTKAINKLRKEDRLMKSVISIGNQDFVSIRKNHCFYIDKTDFIREWWDKQDTEYEYDGVFLFCEPCRLQTVL